MKIDAHQHFWQYDTKKHEWIDESMSKIRKDFLPTDLKPLLDQEGIDGSVAVQADESLQENEFLLGLSQKHPWVKKVVGWIDLCSKEVQKDLEKYKQEEKMAGFRMILQGKPPELMADSAFRNGMGQLGKLGYTYDILIFPHHLEAAIDLVKNFPDQAFVVDHLAKPYIKDGKIDGWAKHMKTLASFENVNCKVSGMVTEANWNSWKKEDFKPYMEVVLEAFGSKRLMFGSDWPVALVASTYPSNIDIVWDFIQSLTPEEQGNIMGKTAAKFYDIQ